MESHDLQATPQIEPEIPEEPKSPLDRFIEAITSPVEAFQGLLGSERLKAIIGWGMVIGMIVYLFAGVAGFPSDEAYRKQQQKQMDKIEEMHENGDLSEEQYRATIDQMEMPRETAMMWQTVGTVVLMPIWWVIIGLLLYGIMRVVSPDPIDALTYPVALSTYMIALMIPVIERLVTGIGAYFTDDQFFSLDPSLFIEQENLIVKGALSFINPFFIWWVFVLGTGIAVVTGASRGKAIAIWAGLWITITMIGASIAQFFAGLSGM